MIPVNDGIAGGYHQSEFSLPAILSDLPKSGEWARAYLHAEIGDTSAVAHVVLSARVQDGSTDRVVARAMHANSSTFRSAMPGNRSYWIATKPFQMPVDGKFDRIAMGIGIVFPMTAPGPFTVKLSRPILRLCADPRIAWGY